MNSLIEKIDPSNPNRVAFRCPICHELAWDTIESWKEWIYNQNRVPSCEGNCSKLLSQLIIHGISNSSLDKYRYLYYIYSEEGKSELQGLLSKDYTMRDLAEFYGIDRKFITHKIVLYHFPNLDLNERRIRLRSQTNSKLIQEGVIYNNFSDPEWYKKNLESQKENKVGIFNPEIQRGYGNCGFINSTRFGLIHYRSNLERLHLIDLEKDKYCIGLIYEPYEISYTNGEGVIKSYIPDLFVCYINRPNILVEIKPEFKLQDEDVILKLKAGREFAKNHNFEFEVWTEFDF